MRLLYMTEPHLCNMTKEKLLDVIDILCENQKKYIELIVVLQKKINDLEKKLK